MSDVIYKDISSDILRKYVVIAVIEKHTANISQISEISGIPSSTVKRLIAQIRHDFGMDIRHAKASIGDKRAGYYHIHHWGIINRAEFLITFGGHISEFLKLNMQQDAVRV